jgi:hypothetical protein
VIEDPKRSCPKAVTRISLAISSGQRSCSCMSERFKPTFHTIYKAPPVIFGWSLTGSWVNEDLLINTEGEKALFLDLGKILIQYPGMSDFDDHETLKLGGHHE